MVYYVLHLYARMHTCIHAHICTYMHTLMQIHIHYLHIFTHICIHIHTHMYICITQYIHNILHTLVYIYVDIHIDGFLFNMARKVSSKSIRLKDICFLQAKSVAECRVGIIRACEKLTGGHPIQDAQKVTRSLNGPHIAESWCVSLQCCQLTLNAVSSNRSCGRVCQS